MFTRRNIRVVTYLRQCWYFVFCTPWLVSNVNQSSYSRELWKMIWIYNVHIIYVSGVLLYYCNSCNDVWFATNVFCVQVFHERIQLYSYVYAQIISMLQIVFELRITWFRKNVACSRFHAGNNITCIKKWDLVLFGIRFDVDSKRS
jgi:hypothetical protein